MASKAPGKAHRKGISLIEITTMFPTDEAAEKWIAAAALARWSNLPALRLSECPGRHAPLHDAPLPGLPESGHVLPEDRHRHAPHPARLPGVGHRHLPAGNQPQGRVEHEAAS